MSDLVCLYRPRCSNGRILVVKDGVVVARGNYSYMFALAEMN
jgi:hypothetical protein